MEKSISNSQGYVYFNKQRNKWNACYPVYDCAKGKDIIKTKSFQFTDCVIYLSHFMQTISFTKQVKEEIVLGRYKDEYLRSLLSSFIKIYRYKINIGNIIVSVSVYGTKIYGNNIINGIAKSNAI